jgi:hypothetical protein
MRLKMEFCEVQSMLLWCCSNPLVAVMLRY